MSIIRVEKNANYVVMNRTALNDDELTWKAKGIIAYMLSMPDDWTFYIEELIKHSKDGEASFRSGFQELKDRGYVKRYPIRDENNKITKWETVVSELPHEEKPHLENPHVENLDVEKPQVENQGLLNTDELSTDEPSTDKPNTDDIYTLYEHWNGQNIIKHRKLTDSMKRHTKARLDDYSIDELKQAMSNYKEVLESDNYYWTHKWTYQDFMKPDNVVRFLDESEPKTNFLSNKAALNKNQFDLSEDSQFNNLF